MRTVSVMAMKFTLVDGTQPVDAHLPQLMPAMLNHIQDQDRCTFSLLTLTACACIPLLPLVHACQDCAGFDMRSHRDQHLRLLLVLVVAVQSSQHQAWFASL